MKLLLVLFLLGITNSSISKISNMEYFKVAETKDYYKANSSKKLKVDLGKNITWDFSELEYEEGKIIKQEILDAKQSEYSDKFPDADIYEKFGNNLIFISHDESESNSHGTYSLENAFFRPFNTPLKLFKRPMSYGDSFTDSVGVKYNSYGQNYEGYTIQTVVCDGVGKLILPNKTYDNVFKFTITQKSVDNTKSGNGEIKVDGLTTVWFNKFFSSAIMKIDEVEVKSEYYNDRNYDIYFLK